MWCCSSLSFLLPVLLAVCTTSYDDEKSIAAFDAKVLFSLIWILHRSGTKLFSQATQLPVRFGNNANGPLVTLLSFLLFAIHSCSSSWAVSNVVRMKDSLSTKFKTKRKKNTFEERNASMSPSPSTVYIFNFKMPTSIDQE